MFHAPRRRIKTMDDCGKNIHRRDDVDPEEGIREYGNVLFADPINHKYPIDTPDHIRHAWSLFHMPSHRDEYSPEEVTCIERRIEEAAAAHGITLHHENAKSAATEASS
jgi:hypothetical protein